MYPSEFWNWKYIFSIVPSLQTTSLMDFWVCPFPVAWYGHFKLTVFYFVLKRKGKKSILDVDPQAQALLEMAGKSRQSEGLREPIEEDEDDNDEN